MTQRRMIRLALLGVQGAAMYVMAHAVLFPVLALGIALPISFRRMRISLSPRREAVVGGLLAVAFLVKRQVIPSDFAYAAVFPDYATAYACAQFLVLLQVLSFAIVRPGPERDLTPMFPVYGIIAMACVGDMNATDRQNAMFHALSLGFGALTAWYLLACAPAPAGPRRAGNITATIALLVVSLGFAHVGNRLLFTYQQDVDLFFMRATIQPFGTGSVGFSRDARLGSMEGFKSGDSDSVALRVLSDRSPGYLRGMAYDTYDPPRWRNASEKRFALPVPDSPASLPHGKDISAFRIRTIEAGQGTTQEVWAATQLQNVLFAPLSTTYLAARMAQIALDDHGIAESPVGFPVDSHANYVPDAVVTEVLSESMRRRLTSLPVGLDPQITALANEIMRDSAFDSEKIAAVEAYFAGHYQYKLGVAIPRGKDPLTYFLLERPATHCEYFASGAAVLLRLAGVPCRYVNGFVALEQSPYGGYWIARNRDAHAWVEAYDAERGWVTVEATPPAGVPSAEKRSKVAYLWDALKFKLLAVRRALQENLLGGLLYACRVFLLSLLQFLFTTLAGWLLVLCLVATLVLRAIRRRAKTRARRVDPHAATLHRLLREMDRRVRALEYARSPSETLHQFARRLIRGDEVDTQRGKASEWYLRYAALRYGGPPNPRDIDRLEDELRLRQPVAKVRRT